MPALALSRVALLPQLLHVRDAFVSARAYMGECRLLQLLVLTTENVELQLREMLFRLQVLDTGSQADFAGVRLLLRPHNSGLQPKNRCDGAVDLR